MTKEVLVSVLGKQMDRREVGQGEDKSEIKTNGQYYEKDGKHYVLYEITEENNDIPTKTMVKANDNIVEVTRKGVTNTHMVFEKNKKNVTYYDTPYGSIQLGVDTRKLNVVKESDRIRIELEYSLDCNYEYLYDCNLSVDIQSRG
ncbi:Uncharacterized beta-barrel protein YwiB, DUF1934 family [Lachnospiraceae bacterium C7]|nr:Uncharacterized beta-barrel protein YwiB, DUF1934 family [Lachnospiraceae bacterium C7]